jgi:hypothetical protein
MRKAKSTVEGEGEDCARAVVVAADHDFGAPIIYCHAEHIWVKI